MRTLLSTLLAIALLLSARSACAQPAGSYMTNFRFGPALGVNDAWGQLHVGFDFGAVVSDSKRARIYFIAPLDFGLGGWGSRIMMEPGVQADIRLPFALPLYISPRAGAGLGILTSRWRGADSSIGFAFNLGAEVKYVLDGTFNFSFSPIRLDFFPVGSNQGGAVPVWYTMLFGAGINF